MANYVNLKNEVTNDPLARGYASMTDAQVAADLNTAYRTRERTSLSGSEIFNSIVPAEFAALADSQKQFVRDVFSLGDSVNVSTGTNARAVLLDAFGAGSTTRTNLAALVLESISRAQELELWTITEQDVGRVR